MFCPKCGSNLSDDAAFCGSCGARIEAKPASTQQAPSQAAAAPSTSSKPVIQPAAIAAAVAAVLCIMLTLVPWFETSSTLQMAGGAASGLIGGVSSLFGGSASAGSAFEFEEAYTVWGLLGFADAFGEYASAYASLGGSSSAQGAAALIGIFSWACLILWIASVALLAIGAVMAFAKRGMGALRAGSILMVVTVIAFYAFANMVGDDTGAANAMPILCAVLAVVAFACSFGVKKNA